MITPLTDAYENKIKPWREGYATANYENTMQYKGVNISEDLMMYVHYFTEINVDDDFIPYVDSEILNDSYYDCVEDKKIFLGINFGTCPVISSASLLSVSALTKYSLIPENSPLLKAK